MDSPEQVSNEFRRKLRGEERSDGRPVGVVVGVRNSLSEHEVTVERLAQLESQAQRGSAAKAVCTLERSAR